MSDDETKVQFLKIRLGIIFMIVFVAWGFRVISLLTIIANK